MHHPSLWLLQCSDLCAPNSIRSAWCSSAATVDPEDTLRCYVGLTILPQQQRPQSQMPSQAYATYAMGPQVSFPFRVESPMIIMLYFDVCYSVCFLFSSSHVAAMVTNGGSNIGVCNIRTLCSIPLAGIYASWWWSMAHTRSAQSGCSPSTFWVGGASWYSFSCSPVIPSILPGIQHWQLGRESVTQSLCLPKMVGRGLPFPSTKWHSWLWIPRVLKLVILVWWLSIRLMNLLATGWQSTLLLNHQ